MKQGLTSFAGTKEKLDQTLFECKHERKYTRHISDDNRDDIYVVEYCKDCDKCLGEEQ